MAKPNIIYIFSDQHRGDALGCSGHPAVKTPNLDSLAAEGINFTNAYTNSPLCMPARASMMTGKYPCDHGVWTNKMEADPKENPSHVRNIRDNGYHTAVIGKTHLYVHITSEWKHTKEKVNILKNWGFKDIQELTGPLATISHDSPYTDYLKEKDLLKTHREYMISYFGSGENKFKSKPWTLPPCPLPTEDHLDSYTGQQAVEWIRNYDEKKPFYLQVLFPGPHDPFDSPQEYRELYNPKDIPPAIMEWPKEPIPLPIRSVLKWSGLEDMTIEENQKLQTYYYGKISLIDEYIGRIVKALDEKNLLDNTWIIYNSDHGEMLGDHRMKHKLVFYDGAVKVPLIIRPPDGIKGWKSRALTDHIDIAATLIDITNSKHLKGGYGRSLVPNIKSSPKTPKAHEGKEYIFSEVYGYSSILNTRYKLLMNTKSSKPIELFDKRRDPKELKNWINEASLESEKQKLLGLLKKEIKSHLNSKKLYELK